MTAAMLGWNEVEGTSEGSPAGLVVGVGVTGITIGGGVTGASDGEFVGLPVGAFVGSNEGFEVGAGLGTDFSNTYESCWQSKSW